MKVALVGAGNVGTAVAHLLKAAGHDIVAVASRTLDSALRASERLEADVYKIEEVPPADIMLLGASDNGIESLASVIAPNLAEGSFVCHFAGSMGVGALKPVVARGVSGCAIHPVQACPSVDAAIERLPGSAWGVTCTDPTAEDLMLELIDRDLKGFSVVLPEDLRPTWHAAAVTTSNGIAALMAVGEGLLEAIGIDDPVRVLGPLAGGTVENARAGGGGALTLTGPVVRGDLSTLARHLEALKDQPGGLMLRYQTVTMLIVSAAQAAGRLDAEQAIEIMRLFKSQ